MRANLIILKSTGLHAAAVIAKAHKKAKSADVYEAAFVSDLEVFMSVREHGADLGVFGRDNALLAVVNFA